MGTLTNLHHLTLYCPYDSDETGKEEEDAEAERLLEAIAAWTPSRNPGLGPRPSCRVPVRNLILSVSLVPVAATI